MSSRFPNVALIQLSQKSHQLFFSNMPPFLKAAIATTILLELSVTHRAINDFIKLQSKYPISANYGQFDLIFLIIDAF